MSKMSDFVQAISRRQEVINNDLSSPKKEGHWSWFLMPLILEQNKIPSIGTEKYYLHSENDIEDFLQNDFIQYHYVRLMNHLSHLIQKGQKMKRKMDPATSIKFWLGGEDYIKLRKHIEDFAPVVDRLGKNDLLEIYRKIIS